MVRFFNANYRTVIIPNCKLSHEIYHNIMREGRRRLDVEMKFNYGHSPEQTQAIFEIASKDQKKCFKALNRM